VKLASFSRRRSAAQDPLGVDLEGRRGFTMLGVLTAVVILGTLVRVAIPNLHHVLLNARAAEVIGDFEAVRVAVGDYRAAHASWPRDGYTGEIPPGLAEYLPEGFRFEGAGYRLDWENWVLPSGLPGQPDREVLLGISIVTDDPELGYAVADILGGSMASYALGSSYTFVVERM
jgi:type II secretory pathway pseudopilin PulG